jgi:hypothetical protein
MSLKFLQPPLKGDIRWLVVTTITLLAIVWFMTHK